MRRILAETQTSGYMVLPVSGLDQTVGKSATSFEVNVANTNSLSEYQFYVQATIVQSGITYVSPQLTYRHGCDARWTPLVTDGTFVNQVNMASPGQGIYTVQGISINNPGCTIGNKYLSTSNSMRAGHDGADPPFKLADSCSNNDYTCNHWQLNYQCGGTFTYYLAVEIGPNMLIFSEAITVTIVDPCLTANFVTSTVGTVTQFSQSGEFTTDLFTINPSACAHYYNISTANNAISAPADLGLVVGNNLKMTSTATLPTQHIFYLKATITCSTGSPVWSPVLTLNKGCGTWSTLGVDDEQVAEGATFDTAVGLLSGSTIKYDIKGIMPAQNCSIKSFFVSSSSTQKASFLAGTTIVQDPTCQIPTECTQFDITSTGSDFVFYVGVSIGEGSDYETGPNDADIFYQTPVAVTMATGCGSAIFENPDIVENAPGAFSGGTYSNQYWSAENLVTDPYGCGITYEISSVNTMVIAPANLNPIVDTSDSKSFNVTYADSQQVAKTNFYVKASITGASAVWWSHQLAYYQGCSTDWNLVIAYFGFVNSVTAVAGQTTTFTFQPGDLKVFRPDKGCEVEIYQVSASSSSVTAITGGTIVKSSGCSDPCTSWDITPTPSSQASSFDFYFVLTIPGNNVMYAADADNQRVTVTVLDGCSSGTFDDTTIAYKVQYDKQKFSSKYFKTSPSGCPITYQISTVSGSIVAPPDLDSNVDMSHATKFKFKPTRDAVSEFYLKATIDGSSTAPFWSNKLTLYHSCAEDWDTLTDDGSFQRTLTGHAGGDIPYTIQGLSLLKPQACAVVLDYDISSSSTSQVNFTADVLEVRPNDQTDSPKLLWQFQMLEPGTHTFYVRVLFNNTNGDLQQLYSEAVVLTITPGPCASYLTINGLHPFQSKQDTEININTVTETGNIGPSWIKGQNLVFPLDSYASSNYSSSITPNACDIEVIVKIKDNSQNLVINTVTSAPVSELSIAMPGNSNKTIEFEVAIKHGGLTVDEFNATVNFIYYCDPSIIDYSRLMIDTTGNLLTNATSNKSDSFFSGDLKTFQSNQYPSFKFQPGQQISYVYQSKCPLGFKVSDFVASSGFNFDGIDKFQSQVQPIDQFFDILRPIKNVSATFTLETHYLGGLKVDKREIKLKMFQNCFSEQGLGLNETFITDRLCYVHQNCTVGTSISVVLNDSLTVKDGCRSELTLGQELLINATNYTEMMKESYKLANNVLKVATPRSNETQRLTIEIVAVSNQGRKVNSGQYLQFDFLLGINDAPQFLKLQVAQIVENVTQYSKLTNYTYGDTISADFAIKESEKRPDLTWYTFFTAQVADDEGDRFLVEFPESEYKAYKNLIQVVNNDTDVDFQINLNAINSLTREQMILSLVLKDKFSALNNTYEINLKVGYTQDIKPAFTPTFEIDEKEEPPVKEETPEDQVAEDDEEEEMEEKETEENDDDTDEDKTDDADLKGIKKTFSEDQESESVDEEGDEIDEEALKAAEEEKKKKKLKDEVFSIIDLDIDDDPTTEDEEGENSTDPEGEEEREKKAKKVDREKEQKLQAVELIDQMDSEELESLKDFLKEKATEEPVPEGEVWDEEEEEEPEEEKSDVVEIVEEVVPSKPPGFKEVNPILLFAIEKDLKMESQKKQEAFKEKQKKQLEETGVEPVPPKAVKMKIGGISKDGNMGLGFNQPLALPSFTDKQGRRRLAGTDQIDMSKVIGIKMEPKSDVEAQKLKYYIEVVEWTEDKLDVKVKFKDSDKLSQGETNDQIQIEIMNPGYFASRDSGVAPDPKDQRPDDAQNSVPEQLPDGMSEEEIRKSAAQGKNTGLTVVILQLLAQLFLKTGMDKMWGLFFTLQLVQSITIYSESIPPVSQVWVEQIRTLVDFEMLKPDPLMQLYDRDLSVKYIMEVLKNETKKEKLVMTKNFDASGIKSADFVVNMSTIILIVTAVIVVLFVAILFSVILPSKTLREKIKGKVRTAKEGFFWNGFIRSQSISYLTMCLSLCALYKDMMSKPELDMTQLGIFTGIMILLVVYPLIIMCYLGRQDIDELGKEKKQAKVSNLIKGLKLSRHKWAKYYYPVFMVRRLLFVIIVMFIPFDSCIQMQALIFSSSLYIMWYAGIRPHLERLELYLEVFNEVVMQLIFYHLMVFSDFYVGEGRVSIKLYASYTFVFLLGSIILVNLIYVLTQMFWQIKKYLRLRKLKKDAEQQMELHKGLIEAKSKEVDKIFSAINPETEEERKNRLQRENEEFEKSLSAQMDTYEQKHGKLYVDAAFDSMSNESINSRKQRSQLKKKLSVKMQKAQSKMRGAKTTGNKRNNACINMETIQENSVDDDNDCEKTENNGSSQDESPVRVVESDDDEMISQGSEDGYKLPPNDEEDSKEDLQQVGAPVNITPQQNHMTPELDQTQIDLQNQNEQSKEKQELEQLRTAGVEVDILEGNILEQQNQDAEQENQVAQLQEKQKGLHLFGADLAKKESTQELRVDRGDLEAQKTASRSVMEQIPVRPTRLPPLKIKRGNDVNARLAEELKKQIAKRKRKTQKAIELKKKE